MLETSYKFLLAAFFKIIICIWKSFEILETLAKERKNWI